MKSRFIKDTLHETIKDNHRVLPQRTTHIYTHALSCTSCFAPYRPISTVCFLLYICITTYVSTIIYPSAACMLSFHHLLICVTTSQSVSRLSSSFAPFFAFFSCTLIYLMIRGLFIVRVRSSSSLTDPFFLLLHQ